MKLHALALLVGLAAACTPPPGEKASSDASPGAPGKCTRFGQTCEFAPGKLGSCVQKSSCQGDDCFICQSQH